jgi:hypothetical protein
MIALTNLKSLLSILCVAWALLLHAPLHAQPSASKSQAGLDLYAVDAAGNRIADLEAGKYVALIVEADTKTFPDKASVRLSVRATFNTEVLGQPVKYSVNLPLSGSVGSGKDPSIGTATSGQKLGTALENKVWRERVDFYVPRETPAGSVTIRVRASATSAKPVVRNFTFNVVRPR